MSDAGEISVAVELSAPFREHLTAFQEHISAAAEEAQALDDLTDDEAWEVEFSTGT